MKHSKVIFGSIIAVILLAFYAYALWAAIELAAEPLPEGETIHDLPDGIGRTMATLGTLVSAIVIVELAITKSGEMPFANRFGGQRAQGQDDDPPTLAKAFAILYVGSWIALGAWAYYIGELRYADKVPELTSYAQAWLGTAVAALYAYFGINPE